MPEDRPYELGDGPYQGYYPRPEEHRTTPGTTVKPAETPKTNVDKQQGETGEKANEAIQG
jgi:hypothetical protein